MDFLSLGYILFVGATLLLYYNLQSKFQWKVLLASNLVFYLICGKWNLIFILFTSFTIFIGALRMEKISSDYKLEKKKDGLSREDKKILKARFQNKKRIVLWSVLVLNLTILAYMKYFRVMFGTGRGLLLPLGISFYTFQAVGYLIDVYGEKYPAEKNYAKFLTFISFFPQLIQGPINRYDKIEPQLSAPHSFSVDRAKRAALLIMYGLMKKYAIANMLEGSIAAVFDSSADTLPGSLIVFSILMYSAQQYADFSGGIDIVLGVALLFDIEMMPNFRQPYFATSLGDFWRRWHISLGAWMRDYVFYPFALLKSTQNFGKWCGKHLGKHFGRVLPAGVANILVFFLVGIWHGADLHYVWWGLYNGIVIALSDLMEPAFAALTEKLKINAKSAGMHVFRIIRTFIIVNIGWYFDRIEDMGKCLSCMKRTVTDFASSEFLYSVKNIMLNPDTTSPQYVLGGMALSVFCIILVFCVSILREQNRDVFSMLNAKSGVLYDLAIVILVMLTFTSFVFMTSTGGFLYANF